MLAVGYSASSGHTLYAFIHMHTHRHVLCYMYTVSAVDKSIFVRLAHEYLPCDVCQCLRLIITTEEYSKSTRTKQRFLCMPADGKKQKRPPNNVAKLREWDVSSLVRYLKVPFDSKLGNGNFCRLVMGLSYKNKFLLYKTWHVRPVCGLSRIEEHIRSLTRQVLLFFAAQNLERNRLSVALHHSGSVLVYILIVNSSDSQLSWVVVSP